MTRLPNREDLHTEFKTSFNEEVIVSFVAFANAKGGKVYVGGRPTAITCCHWTRLPICTCKPATRVGTFIPTPSIPSLTLT